MKAQISVLILIISLTIANAQNVTTKNTNITDCKVLYANDYLTASLDKVLVNSGIEVINTQPAYIELNLGKELKIKTFIDVDSDKQFLIFNGSNKLQDGTTITQAKELVSDMNSGTNFIKATYNQEKNKIDFTYFFWIKDGFTEKSLISALEMYRLTYIYTFTFDKNNLLK